jgi:hypothetical protein
MELEMSIDDVTPEETVRIAGILEQKVTQAYADKNKFKAEADSLRTALDVMTADRDYWRHRGEEAELERDEARESEEYMHRQWENVGAVARETLEYRNARKKKPRPQLVLSATETDEARHNATVAQFAPPHVRNQERQ